MLFCLIPFLIVHLILLFRLIPKVNEQKQYYGSKIFISLIIGIFIPVVAWVAEWFVINFALKKINQNSLYIHRQIKKYGIVQLVFNLITTILWMIAIIFYVYREYPFAYWITHLDFLYTSTILYIPTFVILILLVCYVAQEKKVYGNKIFICSIIGIFIPLIALVIDCILINSAIELIKKINNSSSDVTTNATTPNPNSLNNSIIDTK
ncbi:MAG: hypothetical protein HUJ42_02005 [Malacoplasma sp.]|nr:hypothetical protein [Malacoplasma sp.]